jgi:hypothetical protein
MTCPHCGGKAIRTCPKCGLKYCQNCGKTAQVVLEHSECPKEAPRPPVPQPEPIKKEAA